MKKLLLVLVVIILISLGGIYLVLLNTKNEVTVKIVEKYQSGENNFKDNDPLTMDYTVKKGDVIKAKRFNNGYTFTVTKITKDAVYIKSNKPISGTKKGTDQVTEGTEYVIQLGSELELIEPTTDTGSIYVFEIVE